MSSDSSSSPSESSSLESLSPILMPVSLPKQNPSNSLLKLPKIRFKDSLRRKQFKKMGK